ncbi:hypothetical protein HYR54_03655 [Candidatus Acetothermia bacterium]|nr:hypothetical protein [Candidatus Acetothermia bacterium]
MSYYRCTGETVNSAVAQVLGKFRGLQLQYAITEAHQGVLRIELRISVSPGSCPPQQPHGLEMQLQRAIESATGYKISSFTMDFLTEGIVTNGNTRSKNGSH